MVRIRFLCNEKSFVFMVCKKTVGLFDPRIKNSYFVKVNIIAVHSLMSVESLSSACVKSLEFADIKIILFVH